MNTRNAGDLQATVDKLGLKVSSVFVPWSQSRNKAEKHRSLNWRVTLYTLSPIDGQRRDIITTDYSAGSGHCPSYRQGDNTQHRFELIAYECETGRNASYGAPKKNIEPDALDVLYSLVRDSDILDAGGFEAWASDYDYDTDSRKAEAIYRACLDIALKIRAAIGDAGLTALREAFQDY